MKRSRNPRHKRTKKVKPVGKSRWSTSSDLDGPVNYHPAVEKSDDSEDKMMPCPFSFCPTSMLESVVYDHVRQVHPDEILKCPMCHAKMTAPQLIDHKEDCKLFQKTRARILQWLQDSTPPSTAPTGDLAAKVASSQESKGKPENSDSDIEIIEERIVNQQVSGWPASSPSDESQFEDYHEALTCPVADCAVVMRTSFLNKHIEIDHLARSSTIKCKHCKCKIPAQQFVETLPNYHLNECAEYNTYRDLTLHFLRGGYLQL